MSPSPEAVALVVYTLTLAMSLTVLRLTGTRSGAIGPVGIFIGIELAAVWPALLPSRSGLSGEPAVVAGIGLLAYTLVYVLAGGNRPDLEQWREQITEVSAPVLGQMRLGLAGLVLMLTAIGVYQFGGPPPLLSGGLGSLIDPVGNVQEVSAIREARRELTKGHTVLGQGYAGQGIVNAVTSVGWQVAAAAATFLLAQRDGRRKWPLVGVWLLSFVFLASAGSRSPIVLALIMSVATLLLTVRLRPRHLFATGAVGVFLVLLVMPLSKGAAPGEGGVGGRFLALLDRVSDGNGRNNAKIVELVDSGSMPVQHGGLFMERLMAMVPGVGSQDPFALRLTRLAYGGGENVTGYATPTQYGLMYADWGSAGVIIGYAASGMLVAVLWRRLLLWRPGVAPLIAGVAAVQLGYMTVTGVHGLVTNGIIALALGSLLLVPCAVSDRFTSRRQSGATPVKGAVTHRTTDRSVPR